LLGLRPSGLLLLRRPSKLGSTLGIGTRRPWQLLDSAYALRLFVISVFGDLTSGSFQFVALRAYHLLRSIRPG